MVGLAKLPKVRIIFCTTTIELMFADINVLLVFGLTQGSRLARAKMKFEEGQKTSAQEHHLYYYYNYFIKGSY